MRAQEKPKLWEYALACLYVAGVVAFICYIVEFYNTGVLRGIWSLSPEYMQEHPNAVKWIIGVCLAMFGLSLGGTGIWCALLYAVMKLVEDTGENAISMILWLAVGLGGFALQFYAGPMGLRALMFVLKLGPYSDSRKAERKEKPEGFEIAKKKGAGKRAVTNEAAFDNLIGVDKAIQEFKNALELPILHPELVKQYHIEPPRGIILYGPPGTGKTSLARAVAEYFNVPFIYQKASAFNGRYVGTTEANVRRLFAQARQLARDKHSRVIIFLDEIDSIARRRDGGHLNRPSDLVLPVLLEELDGFKKEKDIFLIAATNRLDVLDEAILRPGRLDKHIEIGYPNLEARNKLFRLYLKGVPLCKGDEIEQNFDAIMDECARKYEQISPADIKEICQRVKVKAAARQAKIGVVGIKAEDLRREMEAWVPARAG